MVQKQILGLIILLVYLSTQIFGVITSIPRNTVYAAESNKNTTSNLVAVLVDEKIYPEIENNLKRYATEYIQKKYHNSKALVLKINTTEYTAPEITKLLENLYFNGEQDSSSQLIGVILVGEIPLPVLKYQDYIFPSIFPYVDFLEQKYLRNQDIGYFIQNKESGQAEIRHGLINFKSDSKKYSLFFEKLKKYASSPNEFVDKKIRYDDFLALQNNFLQEAQSLYQNKLLFSEDLIYNRYTELLFKLLESDNNEENKKLIEDLSESLKNLGDNQNLSTTTLNTETKTPTAFLKQKTESLMKDYISSISTEYQRTLNENISASDRRSASGADTHYKKLQIQDTLLLGNKDNHGLFRQLNEQLENVVDQKVKQEKYAMKSVIPTEYFTSKDFRKRFLIKTRYLPEYRDTFRFFYFGQDASTLESAEQASIFRGTFRNLKETGSYSSVISDAQNPAKTSLEKTNLTAKSLGASYDIFSTQVEANRAFNMLKTQEEYELYQKEKTFAKVEYHCTKRRFGLKRSRVPCKKTERKGVGKCNPESNDQDDHADCETFAQFGKRVWGGASPLNITGISEGNPKIANNYDPKSARKPIYNIAGSLALSGAEFPATSFQGLHYYSSPTQTARKEGNLKDATNHKNFEEFNYFNLKLSPNLKFNKESNSSFSLHKPKNHKTDQELTYKYKVLDSTIKHIATTAEQINGLSTSKYGSGTESYGYYSSLLTSLKKPSQSGFSTLIAGFTQIQRQLNNLENQVSSANQVTTINTILTGDELSDFSNSLNPVNTGFIELTETLNHDYATNFLDTLDGIKFRQIEQNPKLELYKDQYNEILTQINTLKTNLNTQNTIAERVFNDFKNIFDTQKRIKNLISSKINAIQNQLSSPAPANTTQLNAELTARTQLQGRFANIEESIKKLNQIDTCDSNHNLLGALLGKPQSEIREENNAHLSECTDSSTASDSQSTTNQMLQQINDLNEAEKSFKNLFSSDDQNPKIQIEGINATTYDRPIDSPRYVSFQGVGGNEIKLIYPNIFKIEAFTQQNTILTLKTPAELKTAIETYLKNKVDEYNTLLSNEKNKALSNSAHFRYLEQVDPLATPTLSENIRPYKPFTYEELLAALGGEKMLSTLAYALAYHNSPVQNRPLSDDIKTDLNNTKQAFDINQKIGLIMSDYLTQNSRSNLDISAISELTLPTHTQKGYEVGYINTADNDSISTDAINASFNTTEILKTQTSQLSTEDSPLIDQLNKDQLECGFDYNQTLLLFDISKGNSPWLEGFKCWMKETLKKPFELSLSRDSSSLLEKLTNDENQLVSDQILQPTPSLSADKIIGTILEKVKIKADSSLIVSGPKKEILLSTAGSQTENLTLTISSSGENCLLVDGKSSCGTSPLILKGQASPTGRKLETALANTKAGSFQTTFQVCPANKTECGQKTITFHATPNELKSFEIDLGEKRQFAAGVYSLISLKAFDQYKNQISRSFYPYTLSTDKGGFIIGGIGQKSIEISDFTNTKIIYRAEHTDAGTVNFTLKESKNGSAILGKTQGTIIPSQLSIQHNNKEISHLNYHLNDLDLYTKNNQVNENKALKLQIKILDQKAQPVHITTRAALKTKNNLIRTYTLQDTNQQRQTLLEDSNPIIKNGMLDLYILPKNIAGEETLSLSIPGLKEQKINLTLHPGPLSKLKLKMDAELVHPGQTVKGILSAHDQRDNLIKKDQKILLDLSTTNTSTRELTLKDGKLRISTNIPTSASQITLTAKLANTTIATSTTLRLKKNFLSEAINSGLNVMYLNLFGSDWGNQRGYLSDFSSYSENILHNSDKTLAITTQLTSLKKIAKASLLLQTNGKISNPENLPHKAQINNQKLTLDLGSIGEISFLSPLTQIIQTNNLSSTLNKLATEKNTENPLVLTNLNENYLFKNQKLYTLGETEQEVAQLTNGLSFILTDESSNGISKRNMLLNGEIIADIYFPKMNFALAKAEIKDPIYKFAPSFQNGTTNHSANGLFNTTQILEADYQGYDSIQNSDQMDKYIGFRGDFKNITNFAAGKTVGEATIPFGSEFLINIGDPLLERISNNTNLPNAQYNGGLEKIVYSDSKSDIFKVIDIDYNNDGFKDLLIIYANGEVRLQKQYSDKSFKDMENLLFIAQQIKEVYVGDLDGNQYQDILIQTQAGQLRAYLNEQGKFPVDGQLACLNTNAAKDSISTTPQYLSGVNQFFLEDMDGDKTSDIITYDKLGDIKIFYGKGGKNAHSYLSQNTYTCDENRYTRQKNQTNLVQNLGVELTNTPVKDESLIRWAGLVAPNYEETSKKTENETSSDLSSSLPASLQAQLNNPNQNFDPKSMMQIGNYINTNQQASTTIANFEKYLSNPFSETKIGSDTLSAQDQAFIQINKLENSDLVDVSKTYHDINGGKLINGDTVKITVTLKTKTTNEISFFDTIGGPWNVKISSDGKPKNFKFEKGSANVLGAIQNYPYHLIYTPQSSNETLIWSYEVNYKDEGNAYRINIQDEDILDYQYQANNPEIPSITKTAPKDGQKSDGLADIIISPTDGCFKEQSIFFNTNTNKKTYRTSTINLQELSDRYAEDNAKTQQKNQQKFNNALASAPESGLNTIPGLSEIGEKIPTTSFFKDARNQIKENGNLDLGNIDIVNSVLDGLGVNTENINQELEKVQENITELADAACHGFTFGGKSNSCKGLPVPFNQAFLAPGNYHIMGCIPLEPLTRTLGKGLPAFHFPGTLHTPLGPIPMPRGLKSSSDQFLRAPGGVYPSMIRIYAAPTLTAQLGIAVCMGPYAAGISLPSPLSDIGGNCIVTAVAMPCGNGENTANQNSNTSTLHSWSKSYGETNTCGGDNKNSPFRTANYLNDQNTLSNNKITIANNNIKENENGLLEGKFLAGIINIQQTPSLTIDGQTDNDGGIQIFAPDVQKNKILGGIEGGIKKILVGFLDKQIEYIKNNLLRREFTLYLPDLNKIGNQISHISKTATSTGNELKLSKQQENSFKSGSPLSLKPGLKNLLSQTSNLSVKKEELSRINLLNGDNIFTEMKQLFNQSEILSIRSQDIFIKVPRIYSEDIEAYKNHLLIWQNTQKQTLLAWEKTIKQVISSCGNINDQKSKLSPEEFSQKLLQCKQAEQAAQKILKLIQDFDQLSEHIRENLIILDKYKRFPLELYEYIHVVEKYMSELSGVITNFFGYVNFRMDLNATRFSQYVDAITTILAIVKTYQVIIDFSANRGAKCGTCTNDTYDQYTCKLSFLCSGISIDPLPIPNIKLPNLTIDLSHLDLGLDIVIPNFRFAPQSVDLIQLPNLPQPPTVNINLNIDFEIPDLPILPEPPSLPPLPSLIPKVKMSLPVLPPAPKIPEIPKEITAVLKLAETLGKIYCIVKQGFGLVGESSVKAKIEQITQRSYDVPRVDNLDLTNILQAQLWKTNLKGVDYQIDSYVNLQYSFDQFYAFLKGITDEVNGLSTELTTSINKGALEVNNASSQLEEKLDAPIQSSQQYLNVDLNVPVNLSGDLFSWENKTKSDLRTQLTQALQKVHTETEKSRLQELINLTYQPTKITPNLTQTAKIESEVKKLLSQYTETSNSLSDLIKTDYKEFLLTLNDREKQIEKPYQLTYSTNFLNHNPEIEKLISTETPSAAYIATESKQIDGYLNALSTHTPAALKMTQSTYDKSKAYLLAIRDHIEQFNAMKKNSYAGTQNLIAKTDGNIAPKPLLAATSKATPQTSVSSSDYSSYVKGVLVKTLDQKSTINVVKSEYNADQYQHYYQQDMNNDKKSDLILRDAHNVRIKYADDVQSSRGQRNTKYYVLSPKLKNRTKKYESSNGSAFKLYDDYAEVKNFQLEGQNFDQLTFSRDHSQDNTSDGYLIRVANRIDAQKEKFNTDAYRYVLFLPENSEDNGDSLSYYENRTAKISSLLKANVLLTQKTYNPSNEQLTFGLSELPRERNYLQIAQLKRSGNQYKVASPWSNQVLGGRQILGDTKPPKANVSLIRKTKHSLADIGFELNGYVGSYYDLKVDWEDNILVHTAHIKENDETLTEKTIDAQSGSLLVQNLFFNAPQQKVYTIWARDAEGNEIQEQILLSIDTPLLSIENISRFSGRKEGLKNPVQIETLLDTDIDRGAIRFQRERNQTLSTISALSGGKSITDFPVSTDQTKVNGAYFDYGNLIGMYSQSGTLYGNINAENGEISILPTFKDKLSLEVSFEKHYPIVNLMQEGEKHFEIMLKPEQLINLKVLKGELAPLSSSKFGEYQNGQVLLIDNQPMLYIGPQGQLSTTHTLYAEYRFDEPSETITYHIKNHRFGEEIASVTLKVKPM